MPIIFILKKVTNAFILLVVKGFLLEIKMT